MGRPYTEARQAANARYDAKTYKKINIALRIEEDADLIESLEKAQKEGATCREWLRELFENQK